MLGKKLKQIRMERRITQKELAIAIGTTQQTIGNWETEFSNPSHEYVSKLSEYFNISRDYFFNEDYKSEETKSSDTIELKENEDIELSNAEDLSVAAKMSDSNVEQLIEQLRNVGIVKDASDIKDDVAEMILDAVRIDLRMQKLKEKK